MSCFDCVSYIDHIIGSVTTYRISCKPPQPTSYQVAFSNCCQKLTRNMLAEFDHRGRELLNSYRPGVEKPRYRKVDYYKLTDKRIELRNASAATKMPRTKTNQIIVSLLKRVEEADAMDFAYRIPTVIVYGSYVRGETFLSDVDIAVELEGKWTRMGSATATRRNGSNLHSPADVHFPTLQTN